MLNVQLQRLARILLILLIALAGFTLLWLIWQGLQYFGDIILLFFASWLISFIFSPIANVLHRRLHLPRLLSVTVVYLALAGLLTVTIIVMVPVIADEVTQVADRVRALITPGNLDSIGTTIISQLKRIGMSDKQAHQVVNQLGARAQNDVTAVITSALNNSAQLLSSIATILLEMIIALVLSFYMMLDGRRLIDSLTRRLPVAWRDDARAFERHVTRIFGGFMAGQLIIGFSYGVLTWVTLMALGAQNGFLISLLSGIIMIIPFIGPFLAILPPLMLVAIEAPQQDLVRSVVILIVVLFVVQQLVMQVLAPRIMSQRVGLHPLWLFAALLIGAKVAGVLGAFFAAPIAALIAIIVREALNRFARTSPLYAEPSSKIDHATAQDGQSALSSPADEVQPVD